MTDLKKPEATPGWGEHEPTLLAKRRSDGLANADLEDKAKARYLLSLRRKFQEDPHVREILHGRPAVEAFDDLMRALSDDPVPGTEDLFREALRDLLAELDAMREEDGDEPSQYLVDHSTGRVVARLRPQDIIQTRDYVDENGVLRPGRLAVHPSITVGIALRDAEKNRQTKIRELAADPVRGRAYLHLTEPQRIASMASERLTRRGLEEDVSLDGDGDLVEFGRESLEADLQSVNPAFHRLNSYAAILATKVFRMCGPAGRFSIGEVVRRETAKQRWYEVRVRTSAPPQLPAPEA